MNEINNLGLCAICKIQQVDKKASKGTINVGQKFKKVYLKVIDENSKLFGNVYHINIYENVSYDKYPENCAHNIIKNNMELGNVFENLELKTLVPEREKVSYFINHFNTNVKLKRKINNG